MTKFIKSYGLHAALVIFAGVYSCIKVSNAEWADAIFAVAFAITAGYSLLLKIDYDALYEEHGNIVADYTESLNSNLEFIRRSKATLFDIMATVDGIKESAEVVETPKKKRGRPKKV